MVSFRFDFNCCLTKFVKPIPSILPTYLKLKLNETIFLWFSMLDSFFQELSNGLYHVIKIKKFLLTNQNCC